MISHPKTEPTRQTNLLSVATAVRARLEQLENRTLLSTVAQESTDPPIEARPLGDSLGSAMIDHRRQSPRSDAMQQSTDGNQTASAWSHDSAAEASGAEFSAGEASEPEQQWPSNGTVEPRDPMIGEEGGYSNLRNDDSTGNEPGENGFGRSAPVDESWGDQWLDPVEPPGPVHRPPTHRPPRGVPNLPLPIIAPSSHQSPAAASLPPALLWQTASTSNRLASYERSIDHAGGTCLAADTTSAGDSKSSDDEWETLALDEVAAATETAPESEGETAEQSAGTASDVVATVLAAAQNIAAAGVFAVALSPPFSRLLAVHGSLVADGPAGGTLSALWAWLQRRRGNRAKNTVRAEEASDDYVTIDAALDAVRDAFDDALGECAKDPRLLLAGAACATGMVAITTIRGHGERRTAPGDRSRRPLKLPADQHSTLVPDRG